MRQWLGGFIAGQAGGWELVQIDLPPGGRHSCHAAPRKIRGSVA
jgi:hypothetical protein